jgi:transposase
MFVQQYDGSTIRKAILMYDKMRSFRKVARIMNIGKTTVHRWYNRFNRVLSSSKRKKTQKRTRKLKYPTLVDDLKALFSAPSKLKFISLSDIKSRLPDYFPSLSTLAKYLKKAGVSRRRFTNFTKVRGEPDPQRIEDFKRTFLNLSKDSIICIDETGFSNIGNAFYGYYTKGKIPLSFHTKQRRRASCVMAISTNGIVHSKVQDKAFNTASFTEFIKELVACMPSHITTLLLDNIAFHRSAIIKQIVEGANKTLLFIPPYSPKYDPIEEVFSQLKSEYRKSLIKEVEFSNAINESINAIKTRPHIFASAYLHTQHCCLE